LFFHIQDSSRDRDHRPEPLLVWAPCGNVSDDKSILISSLYISPFCIRIHSMLIQLLKILSSVTTHYYNSML